MNMSFISFTKMIYTIAMVIFPASDNITIIVVNWLMVSLLRPCSNYTRLQNALKQNLIALSISVLKILNHYRRSI